MGWTASLLRWGRKGSGDCDGRKEEMEMEIEDSYFGYGESHYLTLHQTLCCMR